MPSSTAAVTEAFVLRNASTAAACPEDLRCAAHRASSPTTFTHTLHTSLPSASYRASGESIFPGATLAAVRRMRARSSACDAIVTLLHPLPPPLESVFLFPSALCCDQRYCKHDVVRECHACALTRRACQSTQSVKRTASLLRQPGACPPSTSWSQCIQWLVLCAAADRSGRTAELTQCRNKSTGSMWHGLCATRQ